MTKRIEQSVQARLVDRFSVMVRSVSFAETDALGISSAEAEPLCMRSLFDLLRIESEGLAHEVRMTSPSAGETCARMALVLATIAERMGALPETTREDAILEQIEGRIAMNTRSSRRHLELSLTHGREHTALADRAGFRAQGYEQARDAVASACGFREVYQEAPDHG